MALSPSYSLSKDLLDLILRSAYLAEIKEWDNRAHLERIRKYTFAIASGTELSLQDAETIAVASMLHDFGKGQMPEALLSKPGHFEPHEWQIVEAHTVNGAQILSGSSSHILQIAETIALTHHERWDGSGYPHGLKGEEIPLPGRIVALADVFDALTTPRPYKSPVDTQTGLQMVQQAGGSLFDLNLVRIFTNKFPEIIRSINL